MKEETIKDWKGKIIGYIEIKSNGDKVIRDFYRVIKGKYIKNLDYTYDFYNRRIGPGDQLMRLLNK